MPHSSTRPEEILAYRSVEQILGSRPRVLWTVAPSDNMLTTLQVMADKKTGFLVVLDRGSLVGVVSERDFVGRVALARKSPEATPVADVMVRNVVTVDMSMTFGDCLRLMQQYNIRYLPVMDGGKPVAVVSVRDLLNEAVAHHARIISEIERARLEIFTSMA
jgi:CBS domain-containing protein